MKIYVIITIFIYFYIFIEQSKYNNKISPWKFIIYLTIFSKIGFKDRNLKVVSIIYENKIISIVSIIS